LSHAGVLPTDRPTAGFTIIEALIALAVVTISIVAIGSVMASTARGARQLEQHVALVQAAYNVMSLALPRRAEPAPAELSGESMDHAWRATFEPLAVDVAEPAGEISWIPQRIRLQVQSPSGAITSVETVRLFKRPAR
jgi:general secretion pathway protein I